LCGSHIDTVPHGGDYDGVAGVVVALELLRSARDSGAGILLELIVFAEEEGPTFGLGMIGSRAWVGELPAERLAELRDAAGQSYLEAGRPFGVDATALEHDRLRPERYLGLIEVHIEQGPGMWRRGQQLAVVRAIAGRKQYRVVIAGDANHAGATSMEDRRDALAGAADCIVRLEAIAREAGHDAVVTVGRLENHPNAVNVVSARTTFTIDCRCGDDGVLIEMAARIEATVREVCVRRGLTAEVHVTESVIPAIMNVGLMERMSRVGNTSIQRTVSGALHDSAILAPHVPTVMLFVASKDGISHNPAEFSRVEDIAAAAALVEQHVRPLTASEKFCFNRDDFVRRFGGVFEHSPWVAERAWDARPFASVDDLHEKLCSVVRGASGDEQLALISAHPDLVGRLAREGRLTRESSAEQAAAGLDSVSMEEVVAFERLNTAYRERFGFPFVICARLNKKDAILEAMPRRLGNPRETEITIALDEICEIARLRLYDAVWEDYRAWQWH
jgi:allantoate deiminase